MKMWTYCKILLDHLAAPRQDAGTTQNEHTEMNITHTLAWQERTETVESYLASQFDLGWDSGRLESLSRIVDNQTEAFARLLETLARKQHLSAPDITEIVRGIRDDKATLSE